MVSRHLTRCVGLADCFPLFLSGRLAAYGRSGSSPLSAHGEPAPDPVRRLGRRLSAHPERAPGGVRTVGAAAPFPLMVSRHLTRCAGLAEGFPLILSGRLAAYGRSGTSPLSAHGEPAPDPVRRLGRLLSALPVWAPGGVRSVGQQPPVRSW